MNSLLSRLLNKHACKVSELNDVEQQRFAYWDSILDAKQPTIPDLRKIVLKEIEDTVLLLQEYRENRELDLYYKAYLRILTKIKGFITIPENYAELRDNAEKEIREAIEM